jgi:DNA-binding transcriptional ArsR family regulator
MLDYQTSLDPVLHAIADPTRRGMVEQLAKGPASVSSLAGRLPMSLQAAMQHLAVLEAAEVVRSEKVGRVRTVSLNPTALRQVERWVAEQKTAWERRLDRLGDYLGESPDDERKDHD